ncbi:Hypothetical protein R9X50_00494500 [Acrodontium crateriforme]|uniref:Ribophorin II C-terminal domain-containing protein n=1 Tax=Acrodontium crateriforme TaxID=150365 RepID=A0AAQ3M729_9PEZI|nr:Hypothetical protein R9X50_00494500 [Acrodontium crateriforme]
MKFLRGIALGLVSLSSVVLAASEWSFQDATLYVQAKGAGVGKPIKETLVPGATGLSFPVGLSSADTLKIVLTTTENGKPKRPHQAFLNLRELETGLEENIAFTLKDNGKGKVELTQKDLPIQFLTSKSFIRVSLLLASFGNSVPYTAYAFEMEVVNDGSIVVPPPAERYTVKEEIHHIFRDDPKQPPAFISVFFAFAVLATLPILLGSWLMLGGNISHASKAFGANPLAHSLFFGSIIAMEAVFFLYYLSWNLFQTLPVAGVVGLVAFVSGSRALTEVQDRRLAGER